MVILEAQCQVFFQFFSKQLRVTIAVSTQWFPALQPGGHCVTGLRPRRQLFLLELYLLVTGLISGVLVGRTQVDEERRPLGCINIRTYSPLDTFDQEACAKKKNDYMEKQTRVRSGFITLYFGALELGNKGQMGGSLRNYFCSSVHRMQCENKFNRQK